MFAALRAQGNEEAGGGGHRIVHGGPRFTAPQLVDAHLKEALKELIPFAPLHLPSQVAMIEAVAAHFPDLPQVACFDTAFHSRNAGGSAALCIAPKALGAGNQALWFPWAFL